MAKTVYQVSTVAQLKALAAPVRHDILDRLIALGPLSVRDLAEALGRQPTAIYRHLRQLQELGLIRAAEATGPAGEPGRPAVVYEAAGEVIRFTDAAERPENREMIAKVSRAAGVQAARDFEAALADPRRQVRGTGRNHAFFRAISAPSPERLARINALLEELAELTWAPDPNPGPLISVAWFVSPLQTPGRKPSSD